MPYIGNPIILTTAAKQVDASATFHRVIATIVMTGIQSAGEMTRQQSIPVTELGQTIQFDIAPTLRAYAANFVYTTVQTGLPVVVPDIVAHVTFHDEYMVAGRLHNSAERNPSEVDTVTASLGKYSDFERLTSSLSGALSLKPTSAQCPQILAVPSLYAVPTPATERVLRSSVGVQVVLSTNRRPVLGNELTYVVPMTDNVVQFQFVNSRGMVETAHAFCAYKEDFKGTSQTYIRAVPETLTDFSHRLTVHEEGHVSLSVSSGYCSQDWARWWAFEFCRAKRHWMYLSGAWVPCSISLKDGTTIYDQSKAELPHIDFEVIPDIDGLLPL